MSSPPSLTSHLLALAPAALTRATTHPFLARAAAASLPLGLVQRWLSQDRLYAQTYLSFAASLLARVRLPPDAAAAAASSSAAPSLEWRLASALIDCLTNIRAELALFESAAAEAGWAVPDVLLAARPDAPARTYAGLFADAAAPRRPLVVGLVALWATEECYLRAWSFAAESLPAGAEQGDLLQRVFIPNWSSPEFRAFVERLRGLVDEMAEGLDRRGEVWAQCEEVWADVLEVEERFWPRVD